MKNRIKLGLLLFAIFIAYCCYAAASKDLDLFVAGFAFMVALIAVIAFIDISSENNWFDKTKLW